MTTKHTITFAGSIEEIGPRKHEGYAPGKDAELHLEYHIEGSRSWYDPTGLYPIYADVFTADGMPVLVNKLLSYCNFEWIWNLSDSWDKVANISLGPMPKEALEGYLILKFGFTDELDRCNFYIPLKEVPPDEEEEKFPWKEVAIGGGIFSAILFAAILITRRKK